MVSTNRWSISMYLNYRSNRIKTAVNVVKTALKRREIALSGLKTAFTGVKTTLNGVKIALNGVKIALNGVKAAFDDEDVPNNPLQWLDQKGAHTHPVGFELRVISLHELSQRGSEMGVKWG